MEIVAKRLTDNHGDVWILLYEEGCVKEPLSLLRAFEAQALMMTIQNELDGWTSAKEVSQENASEEA